MKVKLDFTEVIDEMQLTASQGEALTRNVLERVTVLVMNNWKSVAAKELHQTRAAYLQGLQVVEEGRLTNALVLFGKLNNMIESGASPFDIKTALLASTKAKTTKDGKKFIAVPFRLGVPGTIGDSTGFSGIMPRAVYTAFQKMRKTTGGKYLSQGAVPKPFNVSNTRATIASTPTTPAYNAYTHKKSIYAGMSNTGRKNHSQYHTFRMVSENSDPDAFIHPGFSARNFAQRALQESGVDNAVELFVDEFLAQY